jgi:hypothetical protein
LRPTAKQVGVIGIGLRRLQIQTYTFETPCTLSP